MSEECAKAGHRFLADRLGDPVGPCLVCGIRPGGTVFWGKSAADRSAADMTPEQRWACQAVR